MKPKLICEPDLSPPAAVVSSVDNKLQKVKFDCESSLT